jgi:hypothetical protein
MSLTSITSVSTCPDGGSSVVISCLVHGVVQGGDDARASGGGSRFGDAIVDGARGRRCPVAPVDRFLAYLTDIGRSPNTVKAYSYDLRDYWEFLGFRGLDWREARLEDVGEFVAWLQLPPAGRSGEVAGLPSATAHAHTALRGPAPPTNGNKRSKGPTASPAIRPLTFTSS